MLSEGFTSLIGGTILATISLRLPIYFDAAFSSLVILVALTLKEPQKQTIIKRESSLLTLWRVMRFSLHDHKEVKSFLWFSSVISAATLNMVWFVQVYWALTGIPTPLFGLGWAGLLAFGALASYKAYAVEKWLKKKTCMLLMLVSAVIGYFFLGATAFVWSSIFIIPFYIARGLNEPIMRSYINLRIPEKDRATIFSIKNLIARLIFSIVGPIMGWVSEHFSLQTALLVSGLTFGILGMVSLAQLIKHRAV